MANVNSIRCCGFTKAYKVLTDSRKGCLSDCELYNIAMLQHQIAALAEYSSEGCLTQEQYDSLYQKLKLKCSCCSPDVELDNPDTVFVQNPCFVYAIFEDDLRFEEWTINGLDFITNLSSVMSGYGNATGNAYNDGTQPSGAIITALGTPKPTPTILDANGSPVTITWSDEICFTTCWEGSFRKPDFTMNTMNFGFLPTVQFASTTSVAQNINVTNPADILLFESFLRDIYGPQVTVVSVNNASISQDVTISGVYIDPLAIITSTTTLAGTVTWSNIAC